MYRVSIKSFPDYKYLLQENYVEYKHKTKLRGLSPRANYTDRAAAAGCRS